MKSIIALLVTVSVATPAYAERAGGEAAPHTTSIRASVERVRFDAHSRNWAYASPAQPAGKATVAQKGSASFAIGFLGMLGGAWAGAWLGAVLEHDCGCESSPLPKGALIGAPIGAAAGGVLGWRLVR